MINSRSGKTVRLTVAQAVVTYLSRQYSVADSERRKLIPATSGIFGHENVAGMGQALDQLSDLMPFVQGRHEQSLAHLAIARPVPRYPRPAPSPGWPPQPASGRRARPGRPARRQLGHVPAARHRQLAGLVPFQIRGSITGATSRRS
jgi:hypothetical protein